MRSAYDFTKWQPGAFIALPVHARITTLLQNCWALGPFAVAKHQEVFRQELHAA